MSNSHFLSCFVIASFIKNGKHVMPKMTRTNLLHTILGLPEKKNQTVKSSKILCPFYGHLLGENLFRYKMLKQ